MRRVGVLVFVDDERPVLTAELAENGKSALEVLLELWSVVQHRQRTGNVDVAPRLVTEAVEHIDDLGRVEVTADIGTSGEQKIGSKALHIIKIMHTVKRFSPRQNLLAAGVKDHEIAQDLGLQGRGDVHLPIRRLERERFLKRVKAERAIKRHTVKSRAR